METAFGIINMTESHIRAEEMQQYRPISAFPFLGRYRIVDFTLSNFSNSGICRICVLAGNRPRSLTKHLGNGRQYNISSRRGGVQLLFAEQATDIAAFYENLNNSIAMMPSPYVIVAPSHMIFRQDFGALLRAHIASRADITLLYHPSACANESYLNCRYLAVNRQGRVSSIARNRGDKDCRAIFMDTYVMRTGLFIELIHRARAISPTCTLGQAVNLLCGDLDVRGYSHSGFFAAVTDLRSYYRANLSLLDVERANELLDEKWPVYTRTGDSCPTKYGAGASVKHSVISNGCLIGGTVENSVIGRGCTIKKGALVKNSVILPGTLIEENVSVENHVIDKHSSLIRCRALTAPAGQPGYVKRGAVL